MALGTVGISKGLMGIDYNQRQESEVVASQRGLVKYRAVGDSWRENCLTLFVSSAVFGAGAWVALPQRMKRRDYYLILD